MLKDFQGCTYSSMSTRVIRVAFSPDSSLLAFRWEDKVRVVSTSTLEMVREFDFESKATEISFSPNGKYLSVGGHKDEIDIFDVSKDSAIAKIGSFKARVRQT